jgi:hypothetical protein
LVQNYFGEDPHDFSLAEQNLCGPSFC